MNNKKIYYITNEEDEFGDWGDIPGDEREEIIDRWTGIAIKAIEAEFNVIVELTNCGDASRRNYCVGTPEFEEVEWIDDYLSKNWVGWLEQAEEELKNEI